jgi:hypothetical protein
MAALRDAENLAVIPAELQNLPPDVAPTADRVHLLKGGIYAWVDGSKVCSQDANGNGGCFTDFKRACNCRVADPDGLGSGKAVVVTGLVPDGTESIEIISAVGRRVVPITGNSFSFSFEQTDLLPWNVTGANVRMSDGSEHYVQLGTGKAPAGLG